MRNSKRGSRRHRPEGLEIIFEDRDVIVIVKEAGLLSWSPHRDQPATADRILTEYLRKGNSRSNLRVYTVHRLDRDTSGLLVFAKSEKVRDHLKENWPKTVKRYFTVVQGQIPREKGKISGYLAENFDQEVYFTSDKLVGKWSESNYKVLKVVPKYTAVEVSLVTGRKNQIRVHFKHIEHSVAGDAKYGKTERNVKRLALHAMHLEFDHPFSGKRMIFDSKPPIEMLQLVGEVEYPFGAKK